MADVLERDVMAVLRGYAGESDVVLPGESKDIVVRLEPEDLHHRDSPDFLLWLVVQLRVFNQDLRVRVPILIEAEKAGLLAAMEDLHKFESRGRHALEIPMLVVSEAGYQHSEVTVRVPARVSIRQVPIGNIGTTN